MTETILVEKMARSYWLSQRALKLQNSVLADDELTSDEQHKQLSLYLRYQTTHDRAFQRALTDLLKLRAERRKQEIGFECGTCKTRTIDSGQVRPGARFGEVHKALFCEAVA